MKNPNQFDSSNKSIVRYLINKLGRESEIIQQFESGELTKNELVKILNQKLERARLLGSQARMDLFKLIKEHDVLSAGTSTATDYNERLRDNTLKYEEYITILDQIMNYNSIIPTSKKKRVIFYGALEIYAH